MRIGSLARVQPSARSAEARLRVHFRISLRRAAANCAFLPYGSPTRKVAQGRGRPSVSAAGNASEGRKAGLRGSPREGPESEPRPSFECDPAFTARSWSSERLAEAEPRQPRGDAELGQLHPAACARARRQSAADIFELTVSR